MPRGYRLFFVALAGLAALAIAFGLGGYVTALDNPEKGYPSYRYASEQPIQTDVARPAAKFPGPSQYRTPCANPQSEGESNLCAQWHSASAAENSALWTKLGFFVGLLGLAGLYWQVILTRRAVEDTGEATEAMREANEISERNARREQRAYFIPENIHSAVRTHKGVKYLDLRVIWRNFGSTPARNLRVIAFVFFDNLPTEITFSLVDKTTQSIVGQGAATWSNAVTLSLDEADDVWAERRECFITGFAEYADVFNDEIHTTTHCWRIAIMRHADKPLTGDNIESANWTAIGPLNDVT